MKLFFSVLDFGPLGGYFFWVTLIRLAPHAVVLRDLAERRSTPRQFAGICFMPISSLSCLEGDWKTARASTDRGREVSPINPQILWPRVMLEHETGESAQGEFYLEQLLETMPRAGSDQFFASSRTSTAIVTVARITGVPDRLEIAESVAKGVLSEHPVAPLFAMYANVSLALLAVHKGDQSAAEEHHAYLLRLRGSMIGTVSSVDRLLGLLSQTIGSLDEAADHFEDALTFCRKAGYRPELAWTGCDYADLLKERNGDGDRAKAMALLDESLAISSELGMRPLMERVQSRRELLGA